MRGLAGRNASWPPLGWDRVLSPPNRGGSCVLPKSHVTTRHRPSARFTLGTGPAHPNRGHEDYPSVALDRAGAGMTVLRDMTFRAAGPASERTRSIAWALHTMNPDSIQVRFGELEDV